MNIKNVDFWQDILFTKRKEVFGRVWPLSSCPFDHLGRAGQAGCPSKGHGLAGDRAEGPGGFRAWVRIPAVPLPSFKVLSRGSGTG